MQSYSWSSNRGAIRCVYLEQIVYHAKSTIHLFDDIYSINIEWFSVAMVVGGRWQRCGGIGDSALGFWTQNLHLFHTEITFHSPY